jgi:hypothetical protein
MNKLIDIQISNNELILKFDNGGYIKVNNLDCFKISVGECSKKLNYFKFFQTSFYETDTFNDDVKWLLEKKLLDSFEKELMTKAEYSNMVLAKLKGELFTYDSPYYNDSWDPYENPYTYDHQCLICSNGKAILLDLLVDWWYDSPFDMLQRALKIINENFEVYNIIENLENYENVKLELKDVFIEFREIYEEQQAKERDLQLKSEKNQKYIHILTNQELFYNNLKKEVTANDYDLILSYTNYNFDYLINNELAKPSKKLRDCVYKYLDRHITALLRSKGFDLSLYEILFTNFKIRKCKKLLLKFDAEQIGPDHDKSWQISNFSFSTTNNGGNNERTN